jgi:hypothetical protein
MDRGTYPGSYRAPVHFGKDQVIILRVAFLETRSVDFHTETTWLRSGAKRGRSNRWRRFDGTMPGVRRLGNLPVPFRLWGHRAGSILNGFPSPDGRGDDPYAGGFYRRSAPIEPASMITSVHRPLTLTGKK